MARATLAAAAVAAVGLFAYLVFGPRSEAVLLELVDVLSTAERQPSPAAFSTVDATLGGDARRAILVNEPSRITWRVDVPDDAWLRLAVGVDESAWDVEGDGVLFQVLVSDGAASPELFSLVVNPFSNPVDRGWHDLVLDLDEYAGRQVDVIFNTRASPPTPPNDDRRGDAALWGAPRIVAR